MTKTKPEFRIMKSGYDRFQVDDIISQYTNEISDLENKIHLYELEMVELSKQFALINNAYSTIVEELSVKEKAADDMAKLALIEANTIIESARSNADLIVREALSTARILLSDRSKVTSDQSEKKDEIDNHLSSFIEDIDTMK